jgi:SAM-dependent methyltransferase
MGQLVATTERWTPGVGSTVGALHEYAYRTAGDIRADHVLDVGFGDGHGSQFFSAGQYLGVEVDERVVDAAVAKYPARFEWFNGVDLPEGPFDLAVCFQVIEHIHDPVPLLREIRRVARTALFTTPNRAHRLHDGERPWNRHHVREYSHADLSDLLAGVFPSVRLYGVHGPGDFELAERARVDRARRLAQLDPLGLRYRLPERLELPMRRLLRKNSETPVPGVSLWHDEDAETGLDLFAVCS